MRSNIGQVLGEHSVSQVLAMQTPRPGFCPENSLKSQSWCQELTVLTVGRYRHLGLTGQSVQPKYQSSEKPCLKKEGGRQLGNGHQCQLAYVLQVTCAHVLQVTCTFTHANTHRENSSLQILYFAKILIISFMRSLSAKSMEAMKMFSV